MFEFGEKNKPHEASNLGHGDMTAAHYHYTKHLVCDGAD